MSLLAGVALGLFLAVAGATAFLLVLEVRANWRESRARRSPVQQRAGESRTIYRGGRS